MKINPPFRVDHVGSLLRTEAITTNRNLWKKGQLSAAELRKIEDQEITNTVKRLESTGVQSITDGEFRRDYFHLDFLKELDGVTVVEADHFDKPPMITVTGKLKHKKNIQVDDFNYLKSVTTQTPKVTIPSPTMVHFRGGRQSIDINSYPDMDEFFHDLAKCYRAEIEALYAAGARYIQLDDTNLAYLCDPKMRAGAKERGEDPNELPRTYSDLINAAIDGHPDDLTFSIHLCRGNYKSSHFAEGGYEPVAEVLFNAINVDAYFLEYDDDRSGDFEPLRFVPKSKIVVAGVMSSKTGELETVDYLASRVEEAAKYMPLENLCISPQCGFSSTHHGNHLSHDQQWRKFERLVEVSQQIWK